MCHEVGCIDDDDIVTGAYACSDVLEVAIVGIRIIVACTEGNSVLIPVFRSERHIEFLYLVAGLEGGKYSAGYAHLGVGVNGVKDRR